MYSSLPDAPLTRVSYHSSFCQSRDPTCCIHLCVCKFSHTGCKQHMLAAICLMAVCLCMCFMYVCMYMVSFMHVYGFLCACLHVCLLMYCVYCEYLHVCLLVCMFICLSVCLWGVGSPPLAWLALSPTFRKSCWMGVGVDLLLAVPLRRSSPPGRQQPSLFKKIIFLFSGHAACGILVP